MYKKAFAFKDYRKNPLKTMSRMNLVPSPIKLKYNCINGTS